MEFLVRSSPGPADLPADLIRIDFAHELKHLADWRDGLDTVISLGTSAGRAAAERRAEGFSWIWGR